MIIKTTACALFIFAYLGLYSQSTFSQSTNTQSTHSKNASNNKLATSTKQLSKLAQEAFQKKDYQHALTLYQALAKQDNDFSVQYNLAVCFYKLDNWESSHTIFSQLHTQHPDNEVVEYNLALSEFKLKKYTSAKAHFDWLYQTAETEDIAFLAIEQSEKIDSILGLDSSATKKNSRKTKNWALGASFSLGTDDNVVSVVDDTATTLSDNFSEVSISPAWYSSSNFNSNWVVNGTYFQSRYFKESDYDVGVVGIGILKNFPMNKKNRLYTGINLDRSRIGDTDYMKTSTLQLGWRYTGLQRLRAKASIRYKQNEELDTLYQPYAGDAQRIQASISKGFNNHTLGISIKYDIDDKNNVLGDTLLRENSVIYSATRTGLTADWRYNTNTWSTRFFLTTRNSEYTDDNIYFPDDTTLPDRIQRKDERSTYGIQFSKDILKNWYLDAEYRSTTNDSNIENYQYDQSLINVTLGVQL